MENNTQLIAQCEAKAQQWLAPAFDEETKQAVQKMLSDEDKTNLIECFYKPNERIYCWYGDTRIRQLSEEEF